MCNEIPLHNVKSNHTGGKAGEGNTFAVIREYAKPDKHRIFLKQITVSLGLQ